MMTLNKEPLKVDILASGSAGNCIAISQFGKTILIDAGIAKTKIDRALISVGIQPMNVIAIFVTHAHGDHIKGLPLANKYRIPVYTSTGEWKTIEVVNEDLRMIVKPGRVNGIDLKGYFYIEAFNTHHDAYEPLGYRVSGYGGQVASICLDTGHVDENMLQAMKHSDYYIIESNHEESLVAQSSYPDSVKARILSDVGHLSNAQTASALKYLVNGHGEQIYLTHLSDSNNMPGLAKMNTVSYLKEKGLKLGKHYNLEVIS